MIETLHFCYVAEGGSFAPAQMSPFLQREFSSARAPGTELNGVRQSGRGTFELSFAGEDESALRVFLRHLPSAAQLRALGAESVVLTLQADYLAQCNLALDSETLAVVAALGAPLRLVMRATPETPCS